MGLKIGQLWLVPVPYFEEREKFYDWRIGLRFDRLRGEPTEYFVDGLGQHYNDEGVEHWLLQQDEVQFRGDLWWVVKFGWNGKTKQVEVLLQNCFREKETKRVPVRLLVLNCKLLEG